MAPNSRQYMVFITLFILAILFTTTTAVIYTLLGEPLNNVSNFPVDAYASFEFSYATPDLSEWTVEEQGSRRVMISINLEDTNLTADQCYVGGGAVGATNLATIGSYAIVRAPVNAESFYQVTCRFKTPSSEQLAVNTTIYIREIAKADDGVVNLQDLANIYYKDVTPNGVYDAEAILTIPPLFTEQNVFTYTYKIKPEGRNLLNETEINWVKASHAQFLGSQFPNYDPNTIRVADHYADIDYSPATQKNGPMTTVSAIYLKLYTPGTTSQFDFRNGLKGLVTTQLETYHNPIAVLDLTHDTQWIYRSNCYNKRTDFQETGLDCGDPAISLCGHCQYANSTCTVNTECATSLCENNTCKIEMGEFFRNSSLQLSMLAVFVIIVIQIFFF